MVSASMDSKETRLLMEKSVNSTILKGALSSVDLEIRVLKAAKKGMNVPISIQRFASTLSKRGVALMIRVPSYTSKAHPVKPMFHPV